MSIEDDERHAASMRAVRLRAEHAEAEVARLTAVLLDIEHDCITPLDGMTPAGAAIVARVESVLGLPGDPRRVRS